MDCEEHDFEIWRGRRVCMNCGEEETYWKSVN
jgi:hypothetical protein